MPNRDESQTKISRASRKRAASMPRVLGRFASKRSSSLDVHPLSLSQAPSTTAVAVGDESDSASESSDEINKNRNYRLAPARKPRDQRGRFTSEPLPELPGRDAAPPPPPPPPPPIDMDSTAQVSGAGQQLPQGNARAAPTQPDRGQSHFRIHEEVDATATSRDMMHLLQQQGALGGQNVCHFEEILHEVPFTSYAVRQRALEAHAAAHQVGVVTLPNARLGDGAGVAMNAAGHDPMIQALLHPGVHLIPMHLQYPDTAMPLAQAGHDHDDSQGRAPSQYPHSA